MHGFSLKDKKDFNSQKTSTDFLSFEIMQVHNSQICFYTKASLKAGGVVHFLQHCTEAKSLVY